MSWPSVHRTGRCIGRRSKPAPHDLRRVDRETPEGKALRRSSCSREGRLGDLPWNPWALRLETEGVALARSFGLSSLRTCRPGVCGRVRCHSCCRSLIPSATTTRFEGCLGGWIIFETVRCTASMGPRGDSVAHTDVTGFATVFRIEPMAPRESFRSRGPQQKSTDMSLRYETGQRVHLAGANGWRRGTTAAC